MDTRARIYDVVKLSLTALLNVSIPKLQLTIFDCAQQLPNAIVVLDNCTPKKKQIMTI
jgi:hypothetical protein